MNRKITDGQMRLLATLSGGEQYAWVIAEKSGMPTGSVYTMLHRLARRGLLLSRQDRTPGANGTTRRWYRLSAAGRRAIEA